jgi:uncharacterized protein (DUF885 family)
MASVNEIADRYVDEYCALDPIAATFAGVAGHDDEMTDLSPDGVEARNHLTVQTLAALLAAEASDDRERVARSMMVERLGLGVERHEAGLAWSDLNVLACPLQEVRGAFDLMDLSSAPGQGQAAARMALVGDALDGFAATLREGMRRGLLPALRQVEQCAHQCDVWAGQGPGANGSSDEPFFVALVAGVDAPTALRADLDRAAAGATDAVARFGRFLREELAPVAPDRDAVGPDRYALEARTYTGAALDLAETYAFGWDELARIDAEMVRVGHEVAGGTVAEAVAALEADPARRLEGIDALEGWLQELSDRTVAELDGSHFDIPEPIRTLDCRVAPPGGNASMYYTGPSEDFSRPGSMWWSLPPGKTTFSTWRDVTTVFHEGVPGHHLQVAQVAYLAGVLNRYQRLMGFNSGHGEGWALYAERLMDELGYLTDPGARLGFLAGQALRAVRVVIDIGMHLELEIPANPWRFHEGERWDGTLGVEFMDARSLDEPEVTRDEVNRYLGWPGQAISYKVGERVWLAAREDAKRRRGPGFDLKAFHAAALDLGPMGLDPLSAELARLA